MDPIHPAWFCLRTQQKREHIAAANLRLLNEVEVYNPQLQVRRRLPSGSVLVSEPLFPGYLLTRFALDPMLDLVRFTAGVKYLVQFGTYLAPIPAREVEQLKQALDCGEVVSELLPGEEVQVLHGPFAGLSAVIQRYLPAAQRVQVLLEILGRAASVELSVAMLQSSRHYPQELRLAQASLSRAASGRAGA